jgi:hypothetical protein
MGIRAWVVYCNALRMACATSGDELDVDCSNTRRIIACLSTNSLLADMEEA